MKSRNVRIEYILDDETVPQSARDAMLAAAPNDADIVRYKDTAEHVKAYHVNGLSGWIKAQLQPQTPMQSKTGPATVGIASNRP